MDNLDKTIIFLESALENKDLPESFKAQIKQNIKELEEVKIMINNLTAKVNQSLMISQDDILNKIKNL